jgi:hypothetical protein
LIRLVIVVAAPSVQNALIYEFWRHSSGRARTSHPTFPRVGIRWNCSSVNNVSPTWRNDSALWRNAVVFAAALDELERAERLVVFEPMHWADEATLDLLKYLGRRIHRTRAMLAVTYRDDEVGPRHRGARLRRPR